MATVFTRIIRGELPARFVWRDETCVAFLSINPLRPGHTLVVPRDEVEHWIDLDPALWSHLAGVAQVLAKCIDEAFAPAKVGLMLAGLEVPHVHIHLVPITGAHDLDFDRADTHPRPEDLDAAASKLRAALRARGIAQPPSP